MGSADKVCGLKEEPEKKALMEQHAARGKISRVCGTRGSKRQSKRFLKKLKKDIDIW